VVRVGEPGFALGKRDDDVADTILLEEHREGVVPHYIDDLEVIGLV
jgi:hypothetical protein